MAFSSGSYTRLYTWASDATAGINITDTRMDAEFDGMATALSTCLLKDGTQTVTANIPMATYKFTGLGSGSARTDSVNVGQVQDGTIGWVDGGGTADAITAAYSPAIAALVDGQTCCVRATAANATTTPTFSPSSLTARTIVKNGGSALAANDIAGDGHQIILKYDLANTRWELLNPASGPSYTSDVELAALAGLTSAADKVPYFTGSGTASVADFTAAGRTVVAGATAAAIFAGIKQAASDSATGVVELSTDAEAVTGTDTARALTPANLTAAGIKQGLHTQWIPAAAIKPTTSNGCAALASTETTAGRPDIVALAFDATADEHGQFSIAFPKSWDEGTVTFQVFHSTLATDMDGVAWGLQGVAISDGDTLDAAYGTPVVVTDSYQTAAEDTLVTAVSAAVTIAGSPAADDLVTFRVFRDVSDAADTATEDALLIGVKVLYSNNASTDA